VIQNTCFINIKCWTKKDKLPLLIFEIYPPKLQKLTKQKPQKKKKKKLSMKQGSLFCFVTTLRSPKHHRQCFMLCSWYLGSPQLVGFHQLDLRLFGTTVWKLLIIESFSQWKLNKIKTKNCIEIWVFLVLLESFWWVKFRVRFNRVYLRIFRTKCGRYWFLSGFCCWKFIQIVKIGKEESVELSMCSHLSQWHKLDELELRHNSKMKLLNFF
jgi:hypothetical protein